MCRIFLPLKAAAATTTKTLGANLCAKLHLHFGLHRYAAKGTTLTTQDLQGGKYAQQARALMSFVRDVLFRSQILTSWFKMASLMYKTFQFSSNRIGTYIVQDEIKGVRNSERHSQTSLEIIYTAPTPETTSSP
jgi:hypothetical protein